MIDVNFLINFVFMFFVFFVFWEWGCVGMVVRDYDLDYYEFFLLFVENKFIVVYLINYYLIVDINSIVKLGVFVICIRMDKLWRYVGLIYSCFGNLVWIFFGSLVVLM